MVLLKCANGLNPRRQGRYHPMGKPWKVYFKPLGENLLSELILLLLQNQFTITPFQKATLPLICFATFFGFA